MKFKKTVAALSCLLLIIFSNTLLVNATDSYSWYCVHRKDHLQPSCDKEMEFIEEYNGYYIDKRYCDECAEKVIYLTFDAGYENGNVEKTLDVLKEEDVCGAFFILGNLIEKNPELVERMFNDGHTVCNHTYRHDSMIGKSKDDVSRELSRLEELCLEKTGGTISKYYRPPEGRFNRETMKIADELGYKTIFWSFAYADWDNDSQPKRQQALKKILDNVHNGEVMLLHPTSSTNADILGEVIRSLKNEGYRFGSLDELCEQ